VLGTLESAAGPSTPPNSAAAGAVPVVPRTILVESVVPPDAPNEVEEVEDGAPRRRRRSADYDDEESDQPRRRPRARRPCPECGCTDYPRAVTRFGSTSIALVILGILFWPLIIVAFFVQEKWEVCPECGNKLRQTGTGF
jgi:hypothetical protein